MNINSLNASIKKQRLSEWIKKKKKDQGICCLQETLFKYKDTYRLKVQLTLEQHGFDLHGSTYVQISFTKYVLQYYMIQGCLNSWIWRASYKVVHGFWLHRGSAPYPQVAQGSTVNGWRKIYHANTNQKKAGVAILISDGADLK